MTEADQSMVHEALSILKGKNLIMEREPGKFVRQVLDEKTGVCVFFVTVHLTSHGPYPSSRYIYWNVNILWNQHAIAPRYLLHNGYNPDM